MPLAQKPSILPSSSALAASRPNEAVCRREAGHRPDLHVGDAFALQQLLQAIDRPGAAPMRSPSRC
jgi:hypothetical protein